ETDDSLTGPMNLGSTFEFTMLELAEKVIQLTGSKSSIVFEPLPQDDPTQRQPDISLAGESLDWKPETGLDDGLARTIEYFRSLTSPTIRL
ncbi:MAG: SDR family NAD-dependent epimerase/dehydratase, partial [Coriobacteriia bacterium]|nr:SDR family NAD-dependent epimerase/dehydratase [Coriobacteriia bacterium]